VARMELMGRHSSCEVGGWEVGYCIMWADFFMCSGGERHPCCLYLFPSWKLDM
jgi:hypothetical protein